MPTLPKQKLQALLLPLSNSKNRAVAHGTMHTYLYNYVYCQARYVAQQLAGILLDNYQFDIAHADL